MKIETLLAILFANGHDDIVSRAVQIDAGLAIQSDVKFARVNVYQSSLPAGKVLKSGKKDAIIECPIIGYNQLKLKDQYLVQLPNGKTNWTSLDSYSHYELDQVIDEQKTELLVD